MKLMKRITVLLTAMVLALVVVAPAWGSGHADRQTSDVQTFATGEVVGQAQLVRTDSGVGYTLRTSDLVKGHAISIWWVIFNNPEACDGDCGIEDLFVDFPADLTPNPDTNPAVMGGAGNVVGGSGIAAFAAHLNEGQITVEHPLFVGGPGLMDAREAEIHLVVRSHGPLQPGLNHAMFSSFEGGCEVELPPGTVPEDVGECSDLQAAGFE